MRRFAAFLLCSRRLAAVEAFLSPGGAAPIVASRQPAMISSASASTALASSSATTNDGEKKITVAVIGGGVAGLSCARALARSSPSRFDPTVFDTGRLRPGGRCSSRLPGDAPKNRRGASRGTVLGNVVIDHAAQILTVPKGEGFGEFAAQVEKWEEEGVIEPFPRGSVCDILHDKKAKEEEDGDEGSGKPFSLRSVNNSQKARMYFGAKGMGSIPAALASAATGDDEETASFQIQQDVWVSPNNGVKYVGGAFDPQWRVSCNGRSLGTFDRLVIAHNGKCADRLMSRTPAKALHSLLRTNFSPTVPQWGGKRMTLNSIYSFTFAIRRDGSPLAEALGEDVIAAFVRNHPSLRLLTCQTRKHPGSARAAPNAEVWTVLSSPKFAKKFKAPQENIPDETAEKVTDLLLASLEESLNLPRGAIGGKDRDGLLDAKLQLWGAAVPLNVWEPSGEAAAAAAATPEGGVEAPTSGFLYDPENGVGAVGDWLLDPSIGGAWESGRRLAEWMVLAEENGKGSKEHVAVSVGLPPDGKFRISKAASQAGIGNVQ